MTACLPLSISLLSPGRRPLCCLQLLELQRLHAARAAAPACCDDKLLVFFSVSISAANCGMHARLDPEIACLMSTSTELR